MSIDHSFTSPGKNQGTIVYDDHSLEIVDIIDDLMRISPIPRRIITSHNIFAPRLRDKSRDDYLIELISVMYGISAEIRKKFEQQDPYTVENLPEYFSQNFDDKEEICFHIEKLAKHLEEFMFRFYNTSQNPISISKKYYFQIESLLKNLKEDENYVFRFEFYTKKKSVIQIILMDEIDMLPPSKRQRILNPVTIYYEISDDEEEPPTKQNLDNEVNQSIEDEPLDLDNTLKSLSEVMKDTFFETWENRIMEIPIKQARKELLSDFLNKNSK